MHQPLHLLSLLLAALKPEGILLLSAPNASSHLRHHYGEYWRGLEAPRHLAIPDATWLKGWMREQGFECTQVPSYAMEMAVESERMTRRASSVFPQDIAAAKCLLREMVSVSPVQDDVVQLVCRKVTA